MGTLTWTYTYAKPSAPVLVNRGWIAQAFAQRSRRPESLDPSTTIIKGLGRTLLLERLEDAD